MSNKSLRADAGSLAAYVINYLSSLSFSVGINTSRSQSYTNKPASFPSVQLNRLSRFAALEAIPLELDNKYPFVIIMPNESNRLI